MSNRFNLVEDLDLSQFRQTSAVGPSINSNGLEENDSKLLFS